MNIMKKHKSILSSVSCLKNLPLLVFGIVLLLSAQLVTAQSRWSLEARGGASFATQDFGDADLGVGFGFEGTAAYRFMPHLSAFAGWGWNQFSADQSFAGSDVHFEETGYTFGLRFIHPFGTSKLNYLIEGGGLYNHIEVENNSGDIITDSGHGLGWQIGAGLAIPLGDRWRLTPSVRFRSLSREIEINEVVTATDLNYVSVGAGISWLF
jgi:hypothetical protein